MDSLRSALEIVRNFLNPLFPETTRKRRAADSLEFISPKCRRVQQSSMSKDYLDNNFFLSPSSIRRSSFKTSPRYVDTIVLDEDDDDVIEVKPTDFYLQGRPKIGKYTSTPENQNVKPTTKKMNDDEITFVKEIKSPNKKKTEASKHGFCYIRPFSAAVLKTRPNKNNIKIKEKSKLLDKYINKSKRPSMGSLDYSIRLDDKIQYKKLLDATTGSNYCDMSVYLTPSGKLFTDDTANRSSKILSKLQPVMDTNTQKLSTKDTIQKVLENFENDTVVLKDSDSDSDVICVNPPSPEPDIKVEPVNSFKKIVDTSKPSKSDWLQKLVDRHRNAVEQRQKEIDVLREFSQKHSQINKDIRLEVLTDNINKALKIKDIVIPEVDSSKVELPELTPAQLKLVDKAFRGDPNEVLVKKFNLNVTRRDLQTLAGLNWLNDEVINFYMNLIIERGKDSEWPKAYAFNTFFYTKLIKDGPQSLRRWTKKVDLFDYDVICVPIHLGMHWCMAIIDLRKKSIKYYDSMGSNNNRCLEALQDYLETEHMDKKKTSYDASDFQLENVKDIPQQMNGSDCGMFACTFAEYVTRNAKITFSQEHMPYFRKKMVVEIITGELLIH